MVAYSNESRVLCYIFSSHQKRIQNITLCLMQLSRKVARQQIGSKPSHGHVVTIGHFQSIVNVLCLVLTMAHIIDFSSDLPRVS